MRGFEGRSMLILWVFRKLVGRLLVRTRFDEVVRCVVAGLCR